MKHKFKSHRMTYHLRRGVEVQCLKAADFPLKTVMDALGKVNAVCELAARVVAIGA